jgi:hypothetical protein
MNFTDVPVFWISPNSIVDRRGMDNVFRVLDMFPGSFFVFDDFDGNNFATKNDLTSAFIDYIDETNSPKYRGITILIINEPQKLHSTIKMRPGRIDDIIYVKTDGWSAADNPQIAEEIDTINRRYLESGRSYILVGPGRWGSSDPWLGIPVKWPAISAAKVIVEAGLQNYRVDPSQGTHFFQNLTSFGVGYFTINDYLGDGVYRQDILNALPAAEETQHVRVVHIESPLTIKIDGMRKEGIVYLPTSLTKIVL